MTARSRIIVASEVKRERVSWLWPGRIPRGSLTLLVGDPGLGKSTLALDLVARLTRGELPDGPAWAIVCTAEDHLAATVRPRLEAAQADLDRVGFVVVDRDEVEDALRLPEDVPELEAAVEEVQAGLVVVDPIVAHLSGSIDAWKDQHVRGAVAPLPRLAERHDTAVVAIAHLTKGHSADPMRRTGGSIGLPAAARSALLLARDPDEEGERGSRRVLAHWKCNVAPLASSLAYEIRPVLIPARDDEPEVETSRIVEVGESDYGGRDLLGPAADDGERGALAEAEAFLRDELALGPVDVRTIKRQAGNAGISPRTLDRAKARIGVVSERVGGIGAEGRWTWSLPKDAKLRTPSGNEGVGALSGNPHESTESGPSKSPAPAYVRHANDVAPLGENGTRNLSARELAIARDRASRALLDRQDAERAEEDRKHAEQGELDIGTATLGELQERLG